MAYKNFFLATILVALLSLSNTASVSAIDDIYDTIEERDGFYVRVHWNIERGAMGSKDGDSVRWKGKENAPDLGKNSIRNVRGWDKNGNFGDYQPIHVSSVADYGVAIGYKWGNIRFEFESLHFKLNVDERGYHANKPAGYLELTRDPEDTPAPVKMKDADKVCKDVGSSSGGGSSLSLVGYGGLLKGLCRLNVDWENKRAASDAKKMQTSDPNLQNNNPVPVAFKMKNNGFTTYAQMINIYYDTDWPMGLYAGVGLGSAQVHFSVNGEKIPGGGHLAGQVRVGGKYTYSQTTKFYLGMRAFWTKCKFVDINPAVAIHGIIESRNDDKKKSTTAYIEHDIYYVIGLELGVMYNF